MFLESRSYSQVILLADENLLQLFPDFLQFIRNSLSVSIISQKCTEQEKNLQTVQRITSVMLDKGVDKNTLLINWGGGVLTDLGGFIADIYKRGISFINIPTTLLGMIDAAIGGKNGINVEGVKNCVGTFRMPEQVFIHPPFLTTLSNDEMLNGFGELIKYALIGIPSLWQEVPSFADRMEIKDAWIWQCIAFKNYIVEKDPLDLSERRILNFGHTIGHALESLALSKRQNLSHGRAVALGICCESYISFMKGLLSLDTCKQIKQQILKLFSLPSIDETDYSAVLMYCKNDKKNSDSKINITLLKKIGEAVPNGTATDYEILESLKFVF